VAIARPLLANVDLPKMFARGEETAPKPCTYCNKCLINVLDHPLGCYEEDRFSSYDEMMREMMSFYEDGDWEMKSG